MTSIASERIVRASPPCRRSLTRRVLRGAAIAVGSLLLVAVIAIAAMVRPDIPLAALMPEYGAAPSRFVHIEGMRIHYRDEGTGQPLVLLHGFGSSLFTWDRWVRQLAGTRRLIRLDLPGFGLTGPAPDGDYTAQRHVRVVAALLDSLHIERTDIAGNSMGGRTALMFVLAHPERVRKLILVDAGGFAPMPPPALFKLAQTPIVGPFLIQHVTPRFVIRRNLAGVYGDPSRLTNAVVDRYSAMVRRTGNRGAMVARITGPSDPNLADRLGELKLPVLIQWGQLDQWIPLSDAHGFQRGIVGAELRVYPGAGHVPMEEIPEATARDAGAFLGPSRSGQR
ncbi:MAG: alpha/beta hydrolase [Gemmatimonadetes bacterium]|nr:alpha/beta hydrolase [Gemmatimonadota bacterium]